MSKLDILIELNKLDEENRGNRFPDMLRQHECFGSIE